MQELLIRSSTNVSPISDFKIFSCFKAFLNTLFAFFSKILETLNDYTFGKEKDIKVCSQTSCTVHLCEA